MSTLFLKEYSQYTMVLSETGKPAVVHSEGYEVYSVIVIVIVIYLHSINPMEDTILRMWT
jgi:hypothetical protein